MYVIVQHQIKDPQAAFSRGEKLMTGEGAPAGVRVLQFYPSSDGSAVTCLWEAGTVESVQHYVDTILGDSSENTSYQVNSLKAFAEPPAGHPASPAVVAR